MFRYNNLSKKDRETYLEFLNGLLKDKSYVSLAFMTGILPIKKYGTNCLLNMFTECTVFSNTYSEYFGFTDNEVENLCTKFNKNYDDFLVWYDGYKYCDNHRIFNSNSVVKAISENRMDCYWSLTEKYEELKSYINLNIAGLKDIVTKLLAGDRIQVNVHNFDNQLYEIKTKDNALALLLHLGYLTFEKRLTILKKTEYLAYIPNYEIRQQFENNLIESENYSNVVTSINESNDLLEAIWNKDTEYVAKSIDKSHSNNTSIIQYNDENSLSAIISIALYASQNYYQCIREYPSGKGYADLVYIPLPTINKPALVVELKYDKSTELAIAQIKKKQYTNSIAQYCGKVLLIGINYDKDTQKHSCEIESFVK